NTSTCGRQADGSDRDKNRDPLPFGYAPYIALSNHLDRSWDCQLSDSDRRRRGDRGLSLVGRRVRGTLQVVSLPSFSVTDQVAFLTGASSGMGLHLAEVLAAAGAKVALAARRADRLEEACAAIRDRGGKCLSVTLDVTSRDSIVAALGQAESELGPLSVLVNNAGVVVSKPFFEHTEEDWDHVVDTNLNGAS